jgi:nitrogenase molybdenum-cofactor synthesis protein NifE
MLSDRVAHAFDEPGCSVNRAKSGKERRRGCSAKALVPGAAAGGCAFDGAKIALQPITDAAHLVHGPIGCEGNSWDSRNSASSGPQLYRTGFTTDLGLLDVINGGERRLYRAIREIVRRHRPPAVFVYVTCVPALIGDDVVAVCAAASERLGLPVIPVESPGFVGSKSLGNKLAGETLLRHVIGTREPEETTPTDIAILGEYNVMGELDQIRPLFARLGIRILSSITGDARYNDVCVAHRARLSVVICSQALVSLARRLEENWGIPYREGSFYGMGETSATLRAIAGGLVARGAPADLIERTEALIAAEEARTTAALAPLRRRLEGKRALLYTGGVKSWSLIAALNEFGIRVVATSTRKSTEEDVARIKAMLGEDAPMVGQIPARELYARLKSGEADILLSGGRSQFVALKAKVPWVDVNQERHQAYAGYDGAIAFARRLDRELANPIWSEVRRTAPWQRDAEAGR